MLEIIKYEFKRLWPLLTVITLALFVFGGFAQMAVSLYALSMVALVILVVSVILSDKLGQGLFPYIDMPAIVAKAVESPIGAAIVFAAMMALLITVIVVSVLVAR